MERVVTQAGVDGHPEFTLFAGATSLLLARETPSSADSGWFLGCDDGEHDHQSSAELERISLFEAILRNDRPLSYLGFPAGSFVRLAVGAEPWAAVGDDVLAIRPGSLVAAQLKLDRSALG